MNTSEWRAERNRRALLRLRRALPEVFPAPVLAHALARPFIPPLPRLAVDGYWRAHPLRADRLARALAARSGAPACWHWRLARDGAARDASFRTPPTPYREAQGAVPGRCCICGQPVYRFGWHADLWHGGANRNAGWHAACVVAWRLWNAPSEQLRILKRLQRHRCAATGRRLLRGAEVDHRVPLFRVWREHRDAPWPVLLGYWGAGNLQVINRDCHARKCAAECAERRGDHAASRAPDPTFSPAAPDRMPVGQAAISGAAPAATAAGTNRCARPHVND